jgi:type IV secretion system protein VirB10
VIYTSWGALSFNAFEHPPAETGSDVIAQSVANPPLPAEPAPPSRPPMPAAPAPRADAPPPEVSTKSRAVAFPAMMAESYFDPPAPPAPPAAKEVDPAKDAKAAADAATTKVVYKGETITGGRASKAQNNAYVMMPQLVPCALDTAMDSTLAGAIMCHTTQDVYSPAPYNVLLMPTHTNVIGTYKNDIRNGQARLFAFAGNAETPDGITVPLNVSVADSVGRAGVPGDVDNRYPERFGAAVALTGVQGAFSLGQAALQNGNQTNLNFGSGSGSGGIEGLATEIFHEQSQIRPTISVPPGTVIMLVIDHKISFADALNVEPIR